MATTTKFVSSHTALVTPTDLKTAEVSAISERVNPLIADAFALYVKIKNYHWHVSGSHFRDYHLLFDEQAGSVLSSIDILAERMRRIGATTIRSVKQIADMQSVQDDNSEFVSSERMIHTLIEDNRHMAERQRTAIEVCEQHRDTPTANILQDILNETEKRIWFLYQVSQGGRNIE
jgi:starvation-inducible DNA-binding protein